MIPKYNLEKIKYGIDERTWKKTIILYESGKVNPVTHDLTVGAFLNFRFALLETRILTDGALGNGVKNFQDTGFTFTANVYGTQLYHVIVSPKSYTDGDCTCYLGQNDTLCKHMIVVAIYGLKKDQPLTDEEKFQHNEV